VYRQNNPDRFASPGINGQGIFHEEAVPPIPITRDDETLATFMVRNLMNPAVVPRFRPLANANIKLLQESTQWIERRNTNQFPLDILSRHPTLDPSRECTSNGEKNHEDHVARSPNPPLPHMVHSGPTPRKEQWRTPRTVYSHFFSDEERFTQSYVAPPSPPFEQSQPFCKFLQAEPVRPGPMLMENKDHAFVHQAAEDLRTGRRYKQYLNRALACKWKLFLGVFVLICLIQLRLFRFDDENSLH
jgi:hypothetical protein